MPSLDDGTRERARTRPIPGQFQRRDGAWPTLPLGRLARPDCERQRDHPGLYETESRRNVRKTAVHPRRRSSRGSYAGIRYFSDRLRAWAGIQPLDRNAAAHLERSGNDNDSGPELGQADRSGTAEEAARSSTNRAQNTYQPLVNLVADSA